MHICKKVLKTKPLFILFIVLALIIFIQDKIYNKNNIKCPDNNGKVNLEIKVLSYPKPVSTKYGRQRISFIAGHKSRGLIKITMPRPDEYVFRMYRLKIKARLKKIPARTNYGKYLLRKNINYEIYINDLKDVKIYTSKHICSFFDAFKYKLINYALGFISYPHNGLLIALLLGERFLLNNSDVFEVFKLSGTIHIIAISGMHFAMLILIALGILKILFIPRTYRYATGILIVICYMIFLGYRPSVVRAGIMIIVLLFGKLVDRKSDMWNCLGLAGCIILCIYPRELFQIGFILSFLCVSILLSLSSKFSEAKNIKFNLFNYIAKSFYFSSILWLGITPLTAYYFGIICPIAILANIIIMPIVFLLMGSGIIFFISSIIPEIAVNTGYGVRFFAQILISILTYLSKIPFSHLYVKTPPVWFLSGFYVLFFAFLIREKIKLSLNLLLILTFLWIDGCVLMLIIHLQNICF